MSHNSGYAQAKGTRAMIAPSTTPVEPSNVIALLAALNRAQERIRILEQENNQLRQEIRWIDKLLAVPASIMSPSGSASN